MKGKSFSSIYLLKSYEQKYFVRHGSARSVFPCRFEDKAGSLHEISNALDSNTHW